MLKYLLAFPVITMAASASGQDTRVVPPVMGFETERPELNAQQAATLRCSAAFGIVAHGQANGDEVALQYPPLNERGKEFFVRAGARLMDELGLDRDGIQALVSAEAQRLWDEDAIGDVMPACLLLLDASGV
ncbi:hypothetical protein [Erythrobacter sp. SD-21]|uniref:hypothetical protein n=1 Tax=Erythrobacter sp. SD-21 TaxID=161528 RepID=UPI000153F061|nr:hypothetical protein [Erythrobacter sp. SD-21]EDL49497.1 hypothetical protein ED21_17902 [Erythrobacter sp. SD-21]